MSRKFIQGDAYGCEKSENGLILTCEFEEDQALATIPSHTHSDVYVGLFVPKEGEGETWPKVTLDCAINFLNNFLNGEHNFNNTKLDDLNLSVDGINPNLIILMRLLSNIQQYSINSNSWQSNSIKPNELDKIKSDLVVALKFIQSLQKSSQ